MNATVTYSANPRWALVHEPGSLIVHAGADELFAIDDVGDGAAGELLALWRADVMAPERLSAEAAAVFEQLKSAGIVRNAIAPRAVHALDVRFVGARDDGLAAALAAALPAGIALAGDADLVLFVRTDGRLADLCEDDYAALRVPHLLLDLAFDHTLCLGPLVFPGETACLACLASRVTHGWGDAAPPPRPPMAQQHTLAAGLAALAVQRILLHEDRALVNRTVAYEFAAFTAQSSSLYRLPMCPVCGAAAGAEAGSLALPWVVAT
jgi:bacteriocin biosynthesis cyclodehydratase domain-containing protein